MLVIEDEPALRRLACRLMRSRGYEVIDAADGLEAIEKAIGYPGTIHLIFSDVVMPRLNGPEAVRRVREVQPDARALFVSGYPRDAELSAEAVGHHRFLQKPYTSVQLFDTLIELLADDPRASAGG